MRLELCCLALALTTLAPAVVAEERAPMRVVVRLTDAGQRELVERIRGQTAELDVKITVDSRSALEHQLPAQLDAAEALASSRDARVVVWFDVGSSASGERPTTGRIYVYVSEPEEGRVLVRAVEGGVARYPKGSVPVGPWAQLDSATLESAAMVVRTALRALSEGAEIGIHRSDAQREVESPARTGAVAAPPKPRPPAPAAPQATVPWSAGVGWMQSADGLSSRGQSGVGGRVGVTASPGIEAGLSVAAAVPVEITDEWATVSLSQRAVAAYAGMRMHMRPALDVYAGARLGAMGFWRSTVPRRADVLAADPRVTWSPLVGPEVRIEWLPKFLGEHAGASLGLGADYVPGAPAFRYDVRGGFPAPPPRQVWRLQPWGWVGLIVLAP